MDFCSTECTWRCAQVIGRRWFENIEKLINTIYENGEWPKEFTEVTMMALKKKTSYKMQRASHNQPYCTYSKDNSNDT